MDNTRVINIIEHLPLPAFLIDGYKIIMTNSGFEKYTGFSREYLVGMSFIEMIPSEDQLTFINNISCKDDSKDIKALSLRVINSSGKTLHVRCFLSCISLDGRQLILGELVNYAMEEENNNFEYYDITNRENSEAALVKGELSLKPRIDYLNTMIENMNEVFFTYDLNGYITFANKKCSEASGYSVEELIGKNVVEMAAEEYRDIVKEGIKTRLNNGKPGKYEVLFYNKNGEKRYIKINVSPIIEDDKINGGLVFAEDITEYKKVVKELEIQRAYFKQLFDNLPRGAALIDNEDRVLDINRAFEQLFIYSRENVIGKSINDLIAPKHLFIEAQEFSNLVFEGEIVQKDSVRMKSDGSLVDVSILAYPVMLRNKKIGAFAIYGDITDRKYAEKQLKYLSLHDPLTGLYNRAYFEEEMKRLREDMPASVGIIMSDLDGLKLVNDSLGHEAGDSLLKDVGDIIKNAADKGSVAARIGGDEFAILIPDASKIDIERICRRIRDNVELYNNEKPGLPLNLSIGYAVKSEKCEKIDEVFKEAENDMCREKLHRSKSAKSAIVQTLMKTLEARDHITEGHADRLGTLVKKLALAIGLPERRINDLCLLAQFHDIGKVGIPDDILFKPGPLNKEEMIKMMKHSEIGYRIAKSAPDLEPIADWILRHHEWWNGEGYPLKLKGDDIPLECRILSIVDAYDAMLSDRPYRKAMIKEDALNELLRCAGKQFDPELVYKFVKIMMK